MIINEGNNSIINYVREKNEIETSNNLIYSLKMIIFKLGWKSRGKHHDFTITILLNYITVLYCGYCRYLLLHCHDHEPTKYKLIIPFFCNLQLQFKFSFNFWNSCRTWSCFMPACMYEHMCNMYITLPQYTRKDIVIITHLYCTRS